MRQRTGSRQDTPHPLQDYTSVPGRDRLASAWTISRSDDGMDMLQKHEENKRTLPLVFLATVSVFLFGCSATVPNTAVVRDVELPLYRVEQFRLEDPIDLHIEPRITNLRVSVTPRSDGEAYLPIAVIVGPALEKALLSMTRQHFSKITTIPTADGRPTLSYKLLTYKPVVSVVPGRATTKLNVSARLALQVSIHSASGEELFSTTVIGTSHVSDSERSNGDGLKDGPRLLEVSTRDAIIDAMYDISSIFGNSSNLIRDEVRRSAIDPEMNIEKIDDVILTLRTRDDG